MTKKIAILTIAVLMAGLLAVPLVMAECIVPGCTHPNCPACGIPGCPDCAAHQYQCRSQVSQQSQNGKMLCAKPEYVTVYLYEKDPETWNVIANGGIAMLKYMPEATEFYFQLMGKKLLPNEDYTLIYYPDPWPGDNLICLGSGTSEPAATNPDYGTLRINAYGQDCPTCSYHSDPVSTGNLPYPQNVGDPPPPPPYDENQLAKIWLVLSDDVQCGVNAKMIAWNPTEYLFENVMISFVDTDG